MSFQNKIAVSIHWFESCRRWIY